MKQTSIDKLSTVYNFLQKEQHEGMAELIKEVIRAESPGASSTKKFNLYNYADKNAFRPVMNGVFHDHGFKVASDAHILVAVKEDYGEELEGVVIGRDGAIINQAQGHYPRWRDLIPSDEHLERFYKPCTITADARTKFAQDVARWRVEHKATTGKGSKWQDWWQVHIGPAYLKAEFFDLLLSAMDRIGADKILIEENGTRPVVCTGEDGYALLMPLYPENALKNEKTCEL